jgi:formylmethanofuran dehydrogenase subunit E
LIQNLTITTPEYARIFDDKICSLCGEQIMAPRAVGPAEQPLCLECAQTQYFMLTGQGIGSVTKGES